MLLIHSRIKKNKDKTNLFCAYVYLIFDEPRYSLSIKKQMPDRFERYKNYQQNYADILNICINF